MILLPNINKLFLIVLSIQILRSNAEFPYIFSRLKLLHTNTKTLLANFFSKFEISVPTFDSLYSGNFKCMMSTADELISKLYDNIKILFDTCDILGHFRKNSTLWNWTTGFYNYSCSNFNANAFDFSMKHELFGQHVVDLMVSKFLKTHLSEVNPKKPLIMSFHGQTGCGKNLVSKIIADSLFKEGFRSKFVHIYYGSLDFPHEKEKEKYRKRLLYEIPMFTSMCDRSLFIFDEMDKMVPDVIDILMPFLYLDDNNAEFWFRRNIFIFLSNSGGDKIEQIMYDSWLQGITRESMIFEDFSAHLKEASYNNPGGLQYSQIVNKNVIDVFVPFLPLEKEHVKQCIVKELELRKLSLNAGAVEKIAKQFMYNPPEFELFSVCGCKKVSHKVDIFSDIYL